MEQTVYTLTTKRVNQSVIGLMGGYRFSITTMKIGFVFYDSVSFTFEHSVDKTITSEIKKRLKLAPLQSTFLHKSDQLTFLFPTHHKNKATSERTYWENTLKDLIAFFDEFHIHQEERCVICRLETNETTEEKLWGNAVVNVHPTCSNKHKDLVHKEFDQDSVKIARMPFSIVLTLIGSIIGLLPLVVLLFAANWYFPPLFSLVPFTGFVGYLLGGAPKRRYTIWVVVAMSLTVVLMMVLYKWHLECIAAGTTLSILLSYGAGVAVVLQDVLFGFLFTAVGIILFWRFLLKKTDAGINEIQEI
ncbi:MAG: hypothetical protein KKE16_00215 [Firmicutes bacterium]|nr:hypothetical protein [Bacillota bacterium]